MSYEQLRQAFRRIGQLDEVLAIAEWDQAVNTPEAAGQSRGDSIATLVRLRHELLVERQVGDWLEAALDERDLGTWELGNLREMRRIYRRATAVPADLVEASAKAEKVSELAWRRYRAENDFVSYAPYLERVVSLKRQVGQALAAPLGLSVYDALLDQFEPGMQSVEIDRVFAPLEVMLPAFTEGVLERQARLPVQIPRGPFPLELQRALGVRMMGAVGFDLGRGRLDVSHHPFCGGVPRDVRITTRYDEGDFTSSLMGVLHEAGHGKYEQGLPERWEHQPVGLARGMALHESQSLLLEMQVCRSAEFIAFAAPEIRETFSEQVVREPAAFTEHNLVRLYHRVERSLIRVDADEVTYPAHVLLRYDLERKLIDGRLAVADLPEAWDERMRKLLHVSTLGDDRNGCLQDVHWPSGAFGYFPLYTVGAMIAAQLFEAAEREHPELRRQLARGQFSVLDQWLGQNVWQWASLHSTSDLVTRATGRPLDASAFIAHLVRRYRDEG